MTLKKVTYSFFVTFFLMKCDNGHLQGVYDLDGPQQPDSYFS